MRQRWRIANLPAAEADGGRIVGEVIFRCEKTGEEFGSGFQANSGDMQYLPANAKMRLRCRICGDFHEFEFADAKIGESKAMREIHDASGQDRTGGKETVRSRPLGSPASPPLSSHDHKRLGVKRFDVDQ
jgi:hypothetical protein